MADVDDLCPQWTGPEKRYQQVAADVLAESNREVQPWSWVTPTCKARMCLDADHLEIQAPIRLAYPAEVCIYCGLSAFTRDHLLPRAWSGEVRRHWVAIVPACAMCNSLLNDTLTWSITERRAICHERLRRKYAKFLRTVDRSPEELEEYGPTLRRHMIDSMARKAEVVRMLKWPEDPGFDQRALAKSGIPDGWVAGLLEPDDDDMREHARKVA